MTVPSITAQLVVKQRGGIIGWLCGPAASLTITLSGRKLTVPASIKGKTARVKLDAISKALQGQLVVARLVYAACKQAKSHGYTVELV